MPKKFENLSPAEKRVAIAKDVIQQINDSLLYVKRGNFMRPVDAFEDRAGDELQTVLKESKEPCTVCALGGFFLSTVRKADNFKISHTLSWGIGSTDASDFKAFFKKLREFFELHQLYLIERAFEQGEGAFCSKPIPAKLAHRAKIFGLEHGIAEERLRAICLNIIKNKGEFIP